MAKLRGFALLLLCAGCRVGGVNAVEPGDGGGARDGAGGDSGGAADSGPDAAPMCRAGVNSDGDGMDDCSELGDGDPYTDRAVF